MYLNKYGDGYEKENNNYNNNIFSNCDCRTILYTMV